MEPTHVAVNIQAFQTAIQILQSLPYGQVHGLIAALQQSKPINLKNMPQIDLGPTPPEPKDPDV
jgi:hypothetical protein